MLVIGSSEQISPFGLRVLIALFVLIYAEKGWGQSSRQLPGELHLLIMQGTALTLEQRFGAADSVFAFASRTFPDDPAGTLYRAAVIQARSIDEMTPIESGAFDSLLERGISITEKMPEEDVAWKEFFLGTAYGLGAYAGEERGDWFRGVRKGLASVSHFRKARELDSTLTDALAAIGTYEYWKSRKTAFLNWMPFVSDDRKDGIGLLERCARSGLYNRFAAMSALVSIELDADHFERAIAWSSEALRDYPENRVFLWGLATGNDRLGRSKEAAEAYQRLLHSIESASLVNPYNEIVCRLNLSLSLIAEKDTAAAKKQLTQLVAGASRPVPDFLRSRAQEKTNKAREILRRLNAAFHETEGSNPSP
jgi:tetratricopeptide (TPR) repeat protein